MENTLRISGLIAARNRRMTWWEKLLHLSWSLSYIIFMAVDYFGCKAVPGLLMNIFAILTIVFAFLNLCFYAVRSNKFGIITGGLIPIIEAVLIFTGYWKKLPEKLFVDTPMETGGVEFAMYVPGFIFLAANFVLMIVSLKQNYIRGEVARPYVEKIRAMRTANMGKREIKKWMKAEDKLFKRKKYLELAHSLDCKLINDAYSTNPKYFEPGESKFTGGMISLMGHKLLWGLLYTVTLGLAAPWVKSKEQKWYANRIIYGGKKIRFDGNGLQLLGRWILWELLCIVTLGIYALFMANAMKKWVTKHKHFQGEEKEHSEYSGTTIGRGLLGLGLFFCELLTLGWAKPWAMNKLLKYDVEHTTIDGKKLVYSGTGWQLFGKYMWWYFLSCVTFGIYALIKMPLNLERYEKEHTHILNESYDPVPEAE